jgi:hypothetical protein
MKANGFVEVDRGLPLSSLQRLILGAYAASRQGLVVLAARGIPTDTLDRYMDGAVREHGVEVDGVFYIGSEPDPGRVLSLVSDARFVIVTSEELTSILMANKVEHMDASEGIRYLDRFSVTNDPLSGRGSPGGSTFAGDCLRTPETGEPHPCDAPRHPVPAPMIPRAS